ncbi:cytochrome P450 [Saccharothrix sp. AJ9571]|nr:cytochrome P450 [Saccharothrix sp. AJ9571]
MSTEETMTPLRAATMLLTQRTITDTTGLCRAIGSAGPAYRAPFGVTFVGHYALGREVLKNPAFGAVTVERMDRVWPDWRHHPAAIQFVDSMIGANPPRHGLLRRPFRPHFTAAGVNRRLAVITAMVDHRLDTLADALDRTPTADFVSTVADPLALDLSCHIMGVPPDERPRVGRALKQWSKVLEFSRTSADTRAADRAVEDLHEVMEASLRRGGEADSLVADLLRSDLASARRELVANIAMVVGAGAETSASLFGHLVHSLVSDPRRYSAMTAEPRLAAPMVDETLRLTPALLSTSRIARTDVTAGGVHFRQGEEVLVLLAGCNRDPRAFPRPDAFDWSRPPRRSLSFGGGAHHCLGAVVARTTAVALAQRLVRRLPDLAASGPAVVAPGVGLRSLDAVPVMRRRASS